MATRKTSGKQAPSTAPGPDQDVRQILHQLNQPLTAISNYAQAGSHLIDNGLPDPKRLKELFEKITAQSTRTFEISRQLRQAVTGKR